MEPDQAVAHREFACGYAGPLPGLPAPGPQAQVTAMALWRV